jgi:hypothetical protein
MAPTVITVTPTTVRIERGRATRRTVVERVHHGDPAPTLTALCAELSFMRPRGAFMVIDPPLAQVRRVTHLPAVSGRALAAIVAQQPERFFRPAGGPLTTDAVQLAGPTPCSLLAAARESDLEALVRAAKQGGVAVERVTPTGCELTRINLLPGAERERRRRSDLRAIAMLTAALLALWGASLGVDGFRLRREVVALDRRLVEIASAAESVRLARAQVEQVETAVAVADSLRGARGGLVSTLSAAVDALPRDAHLVAVLATPDTLTLSGVAASPALVTKRLSAVPGVSRVRLEPPRGRGPVAGGGAPFELVAVRGTTP